MGYSWLSVVVFSPLVVGFLRTEISSDTLAFTFFRMFAEIESDSCVNLNFTNTWSTTMIMDVAKTMLTEVYATAVWPCPVTVV